MRPWNFVTDFGCGDIHWSTEASYTETLLLWVHGLKQIICDSGILYPSTKYIYIPTFAAAFKLGRHEWFVLKRLITNSRSSAFTGGFWNCFLKEPSQVDKRTKNLTMKRLLHGTLGLWNAPSGEQIQNCRRPDKITRDTITPWCGSALFCLRFSFREISVLNISWFSFTK